MSLIEQLAAIDDRPTKDLPIPEWGTTVTLRAMSALERDEWDQEILKRRQEGAPFSISALAAVRSIIDANGNREFSDNDLEFLSRKSGKALDRIFNAFMRLNRLTEKDIAELEKNF